MALTAEVFSEQFDFLKAALNWKPPALVEKFWYRELKDEFTDGDFVAGIRLLAMGVNRFPVLGELAECCRKARLERIEKENTQRKAEENKYRHKSLSQIFSGGNIPEKVKKCLTFLFNGGTRQEFLSAVHDVWGEKAAIPLYNFYKKRGLNLNGVIYSCFSEEKDIEKANEQETKNKTPHDDAG